MTVAVMIPHGTEARVCALIAQRQAMGMAKYGTSVSANPLTLREWLQHALEESLDQSVYLMRAIEQLDSEQAADDCGTYFEQQDNAQIDAALSAGALQCRVGGAL